MVNKAYTIKEIHENDAEIFLDIRQKIEEESDGMIYQPGERTTTAEDLAKRIGAIKKSPGAGTFILEYENKICGFIIVHGMAAERVNRTRSIVMGVHKEYWGKGMGTTLLKYANEWSKSKNIHKLELEVWANNVAAIHLYRKVGFFEEGRKRDHAFIDGKFVDAVCMGLILK